MDLGDFDMADGGPPLNRTETSTAAEVNLLAAPHGLKVTGDAAWDSGSDDYAMFTAAGNRKVARMVAAARQMTLTRSEAAVLAWIRGEKEVIAADRQWHLYAPRRLTWRFLRSFRWSRVRFLRGHEEVRDTMVRETIAYALDEAWQAAYGRRFDEWLGQPPEAGEVNVPW